ncbi:peptidyl-prolyl isomerase H [Acrasis kona]|uniref:Peptidyl-prolyl cis-trans isomerase n=1 Tax=Acrasis kona TaxID=1008807 RepID=A0AAW2YVW6_9EUKA
MTTQNKSSRILWAIRIAIFLSLTVLIFLWFKLNPLSKSFKQYDMLDSSNPLMYLDVSIGGENIGRIIIELYSHITPKTAENWRQLCVGGFQKDGKEYTFKKNKFHRIIKDFIVQAGDLISGDGTGSISIYGDRMEDENFIVSHDQPGVISMANHGPNTGGSQWCIFLHRSLYIDGKAVAFAKVVKGMEVVYKMHVAETVKDVPVKPVVIEDCGQLS